MNIPELEDLIGGDTMNPAEGVVYLRLTDKVRMALARHFNVEMEEFKDFTSAARPGAEDREKAFRQRLAGPVEEVSRARAQLEKAEAQLRKVIAP